MELAPGGLGHDHRIYTRLRTDRDITKQNIFIRDNLTRDNCVPISQSSAKASTLQPIKRRVCFLYRANCIVFPL